MGGASSPTSFTITPKGTNSVEISWGSSSSSSSSPVASASTSSTSSTSSASSAPAAEAPSDARDPNKVWQWSEVAKHNTADDCWVVINDEVIDATSFLEDHPGGKNAIVLYAGKDATAEFNMLHKKDVIKKYAPE